MFIFRGRSLHNVFVTSCTPFRFPFLTASSDSRASAFVHSLLSVLKLLFTSLFSSLYSILRLSLFLSDLVSSTFSFGFLLPSILLHSLCFTILLFLYLWPRTDSTVSLYMLWAFLVFNHFSSTLSEFHSLCFTILLFLYLWPRTDSTVSLYMLWAFLVFNHFSSTLSEFRVSSFPVSSCSSSSNS